MVFVRVGAGGLVFWHFCWEDGDWRMTFWKEKS